MFDPHPHPHPHPHPAVAVADAATHGPADTAALTAAYVAALVSPDASAVAITYRATDGYSNAAADRAANTPGTSFALSGNFSNDFG